MAEHYLDDSVTQPFWDNSVTPRLTIDPGDVVVIECAEPVGQLSPDSNSEDLANIDFGLVHALTGSIYVNGASVGDSLEVEILDMQHKGWGWTGHIPAFGLLQEDFDFAYIQHWELDGDICHFGVGGITLPFEPFPGCVGVAPAEAGRLNTIPPRINGGNVDIRDLVVGCTFWLPVLAEGALFSTGDCHSAQGQGEVSGTAIESPMTVTMRFNVRKDLAIKELQIRRPQPDDQNRQRRLSHHYGAWTGFDGKRQECCALHDRVVSQESWLGREPSLLPLQRSRRLEDRRDRRCAQLGRHLSHAAEHF